MPSTLDRLSHAQLEKLCTIAFWLSLGTDRVLEWGDTPEEKRRFLGGVPEDVVSRFERFDAVEGKLRVPDEHGRRLAVLPPAVRQKAELVDPEAFAQAPAAEALAEVIQPEDSLLLSRWLAFSGAPLQAQPDGAGPPPGDRP